MNLSTCVCLHTNSEYSAVEGHCIPHGIRTHPQYELHPVLEGLWIWLSILFYYLTLDRGREWDNRIK